MIVKYNVMQINLLGISAFVHVIYGDSYAELFVLHVRKKSNKILLSIYNSLDLHIISVCSNNVNIFKIKIRRIDV